MVAAIAAKDAEAVTVPAKDANAFRIRWLVTHRTAVAQSFAETYQAESLFGSECRHICPRRSSVWSRFSWKEDEFSCHLLIYANRR